MKKGIQFIFLLFTIYLLKPIAPILAQQNPLLYANKFILVGDTIYGVKKAADPKSLAILFFLDLQNNQLGWNSTHCGKLYPTYSWDIDRNYWLGEESFQYGSQREQVYQSIRFLAQKEWLEENEFDTIHRYVQKRLAKRDYSSMQEFSFLYLEVFSLSTYKHLISEKFTGISSILHRLWRMDGSPSYFYDWGLQADRSILMPILFQDSLHFYRFKDQAWHSENYEGHEANRANDVWIKELSISVAQQFKDQFRFFLLQGEAYFVADSSTNIYKVIGQSIHKIGTIEKKPDQELQYLLDKDSQKLYFLNALSLNVEEIEKSRFEVLKPGHTLHKAVQKLIVAKEFAMWYRKGIDR